MKLDISVFSYAGLEPRTTSCLYRELKILDSLKVDYGGGPDFVHGDALISRSRSVALSEFMREKMLHGKADVHVQIDRDMEWQPGDLLALADQALVKKACVAGFYPTRAKGVGYSGRLKEERAKVVIGSDKLHEAEYLPGGFTAYPRAAVEQVLKLFADRQKMMKEPGLTHGELWECIHWDGTEFWPFFRPLVVPGTVIEGTYEYLSEDWSFSHLCTLAGVPLYLWSKPALVHWGTYGFVMSDALQSASPGHKVG